MTSQTDQQPDSRPGRQGRYVPGYSPATVQHHATRTAAQQAAFFLPHLRAGMSLLDCGCGPGTITLGLAQAVAPGQVVGIDIEPRVIERAGTLGQEQGISNIRFQVGNAYELPFSDGSFDASFASALLHHLKQPIDALKDMRRVLKPGGVIGIRNTDIDGRIIGPANHGLEDYYTLYDRISKHHGSNHRLGRRLRGMLRQAGFVRIEASASYDCYGTPGETRELAQSQIARIKSTPAFDKAVEAGLVDRTALEKIIAAWEKWGEDPDAFCADARCEAVAWKA